MRFGMALVATINNSEFRALVCQDGHLTLGARQSEAAVGIENSRVGGSIPSLGTI